MNGDERVNGLDRGFVAPSSANSTIRRYGTRSVPTTFIELGFARTALPNLRAKAPEEQQVIRFRSRGAICI